jgi:hypothetical protein
VHEHVAGAAEGGDLQHGMDDAGLVVGPLHADEAGGGRHGAAGLGVERGGDGGRGDHTQRADGEPDDAGQMLALEGFGKLADGGVLDL